MAFETQAAVSSESVEIGGNGLPIAIAADAGAKVVGDNKEDVHWLNRLSITLVQAAPGSASPPLLSA